MKYYIVITRNVSKALFVLNNFKCHQKPKNQKKKSLCKVIFTDLLTLLIYIAPYNNFTSSKYRSWPVVFCMDFLHRHISEASYVHALHPRCHHERVAGLPLSMHEKQLPALLQIYPALPPPDLARWKRWSFPARKVVQGEVPMVDIVGMASRPSRQGSTSCNGQSIEQGQCVWPCSTVCIIVLWDEERGKHGEGPQSTSPCNIMAYLTVISVYI